MGNKFNTSLIVLSTVISLHATAGLSNGGGAGAPSVEDSGERGANIARINSAQADFCSLTGRLADSETSNDFANLLPGLEKKYKVKIDAKSGYCQLGIRSRAVISSGEANYGAIEIATKMVNDSPQFDVKRFEDELKDFLKLPKSTLNRLGRARTEFVADAEDFLKSYGFQAQLTSVEVVQPKKGFVPAVRYRPRYVCADSDAVAAVTPTEPMRIGHVMFNRKTKNYPTEAVYRSGQLRAVTLSNPAVLKELLQMAKTNAEQCGSSNRKEECLVDGKFNECGAQEFWQRAASRLQALADSPLGIKPTDPNKTKPVAQ